MNCFTHPAVHASAVCKTCGKAICRACVVSTPMALACSEVCADEARALTEINQRSKKVYGIGAVSKKKFSSALIYYALFVVFLLGMGIFNSVRSAEPDYSSFALATLFSVFIVVAYRRNKDIGIQC